MVQSTALAFYIACIAAKGAKAAPFFVSPLKTGHRIGTNQHAERGSLRACAFCREAALWLRFTHQIVKQSRPCFTVAHRRLPAR